jgi:hypothetical protein
MVGVVTLSRRFHINPDNVATPVGGALGDLTTLSLLSGVAQVLYATLGKYDFIFRIEIEVDDIQDGVRLRVNIYFAQLVERNNCVSRQIRSGLDFWSGPSSRTSAGTTAV